MNEDLQLILVSPLLMDNCFNLLSDMNGDEDAQKLIIVVSPSIISLPLSPTTWSKALHLYIIMRKIGREIGHLEATNSMT